MASNLDVHIKDYGGREFGGEYSVGKITTAKGRLMVQLDYCGTKSSKRLTTAWLEIDETVVREMLGTLMPAAASEPQ
ncbi:MAG: hypothetical protein JWQ22_40 [Devosia sp.]|nr:hypothetical protein [Devosia sp.]